jgi:4-amino-4-deoxy-L-arabinose transferase-like glycosyltransferase
MSSMGMTGQASAAPGVTTRRRLRWRGGVAGGRSEQAAHAGWARPAFVVLLLATAAAYTWNLSANGDANSFYAAAVQAGTKSWKAFFYGALDSSSFITVDKPPASLWLMALSGRIFGFGSFSMLLPQALEGVAAVGLLYGAVKRWFGAPAGLAAGAMLALTPVAALMFRFNNPDALLVALLVASAYCLTRAIEQAGTRWILACGALVGFAFLAKMGQALLVVPGFALAYLVAAPASLRRRVGALLAGLAALVASCGWWVAIVALVPAGSRPFIDGSPDNNIFNLIFGYNGLSRIFGGGGPGGAGAGHGFGRLLGALAGGGAGGGAGFSGPAGVLRLFNYLLGGQAAWLLPAAIVALLASLWLRRGTPRTDRPRAALILWGGWLLVTAAIFSFSTGIIHTYYTVALAPAIAALVAIGGALAWQHRTDTRVRLACALTVAGTGVWSYVLLDRTPDWEPWVRTLVLLAAVAAGALLMLAPAGGRRARRIAALAATLVAVACLGGPLAYSAQTVTSAHGGSLPSAGPTITTSSGGAFAGGRGFPAAGGFRGRGLAGGAGPGGGAPGSASGFAGGPPGGNSQTGRFAGGPASGPTSARPTGGGRTGGATAGDVTIGAALARALELNASHYRWIAATSGSNNAAAIELATGGKPVMAIGGFNGNGGELSLAAFKRYVKQGVVHFYVELGGGGGPGIGSGTSTIESWVASHFTSRMIDGVTVYAL